MREWIIWYDDIMSEHTSGELVRCGDCKWFDISEPSGTVEPIGFRCKHGRRFVEVDNFCKYGERREEDAEA